MTAPRGSGIIRFGDFEVDLAAGQLHKHRRRIGLREKSFQILALLLEQPGDVVTREALRHRLWPDDVFVDFENNLNTAVARLREALGDSAEHPHFIETLPRRGYRFVASASELPCAKDRTPVAAARIAVLPFVNLSGDPAQEYFSDAMTDDITTELAALAPDLMSVIARTTAMRYKGARKDVKRIACDLAVDYVVEGAVRRTGDRVALGIQLVRADNQMNVFARRYQSALTDGFKMSGAVAQDIAAHVRVSAVTDAAGTPAAIRPPERRRPTGNLVAYDHYLQARFHLARATPDALAKARHHAEEAIRLDPEFALAHDTLAEHYWYAGYFGFVSPKDAFSAGALHAVRALEIDNTLGETHALLGQYRKQLEYNWPEVDREMARALELSPASPIVRMRYAFNALMPRGRLEAAAAELERALEWDPLSPLIRVHLAIVLVLWRRCDKALEQARLLLELEPDTPAPYFVMGVAFREQGKFAEAIAAHQRAVDLSAGSAMMLGWLGLALALGGRTDDARAQLGRLHAMAAHVHVPPTSFAWIHLGLGEIDAAFDWLDRAVEGGDQLMMPIKSYEFFDPIRTDPRFLGLLRKMRLDD